MPLVWLSNWLLVGGVLVLAVNLPPPAAGLLAIGVLAALYLGAASRRGQRLAARLWGAREPSLREGAVLAAALATVARRLDGDWGPVALVLDRPLPVAWALGRHVVVVTAGLLEFCDDSELAGVLAHEAGHQISGHAVRRLVLRLVGVSGGLAGAAAWSVLRLGLALAGGGRNNPLRETVAILTGLLAGSVRVAVWGEKALWAAVFRREEYAADAFAARLGLGAGLAGYLGRVAWLDQADKAGGWQRLWAVHPPCGKRLARLRALL